MFRLSFLNFGALQAIDKTRGVIMFGFIGKMFGSSAAGEKIIDGVTDGIDKLWYTDEEKAGDAAQAKREGMAVYMKWLESTSGSRIARRLLAVGAFSIWGVEHVTAVIMRVMSNWFGDVTTQVNGTTVIVNKLSLSADFLTETALGMQTLVAVVFAFYFGGPVLVDASANMLKKWAGTSEKKSAKE
jgi:hypothetical protein